ncbi:hypothetical protein CH306_17600 [Rhodococcus sp. 15-725-2-2b]|uniref:hypothetical protein n=1 Tax=unclassified Rhodococcus (in: high G+C Gram-positive bacteria) TaxID=192944 RepID=UPI000B9AA865|nr:MULTISPECIES: hypothetical protein [unclassified Rhodococcus (in: high G+C Gram-positive bacteria)]OZD51132.1 hypothetical protein CH264_02140 [Rhodococcus sp. 06-1477-1A]OZE71571.1 hypothetical protein CH306_17600 [Rhodococcus sp. 15-725-2-2b]
MSDSDDTTQPEKTTRSLSIYEVERELGPAAAAQLAHVRKNLLTYAKQAHEAAETADAANAGTGAPVAGPAPTRPTPPKGTRKPGSPVNLSGLAPRIEMPDFTAAIPKINFFDNIAPKINLFPPIEIPDLPVSIPKLNLGLDNIAPKINLFPPIEIPDHPVSIPKLDLGLDLAVPRIDLGALSAITSVAGVLGQWMGDFSVQILPIVDTLSARVSSLLDVWKVLGDFGHRAARFGLHAALAAREAVVHGEPEPLVRFMETWLGVKPTREGQDAVAAALLDDDWLDVTPDQAISTIGLLHKRHRSIQRPITESQLNRFKVVRLDATIGRDPNGVTFKDLVPAQADRDPFEAEFSDPTLLLILSKLDPMEQAILAAKASGARTWADAAAECGAPLKQGESVRRKVNRYRDQALGVDGKAS